MNDKKSPATDMVNMYGAVTIYQEDDDSNRTYICKDKQNHFTKHMIRCLCSIFCSNGIYCNADGLTFGTNGANIMVGEDIVTPTDNSLSDLISKITYNPIQNIVQDLNIINESTGEMELTIISIWTKNTIIGTVGEIGLYLRPYTNIVANINISTTMALKLCSRLSVADSTLEQFTIDNSKSLIIEWKLGVKYV